MFLIHDDIRSIDEVDFIKFLKDDPFELKRLKLLDGVFGETWRVFRCPEGECRR